MSRSSHVVFDGYSYEPPSYEEAQASAATSQSVYKPTVSQSRDTNFGGFLPLYTPNGYNNLTEYNLAKRRRRMRIALATVLGIFCFVILIAILFCNIKNAYHIGHKYQSYAETSDEDLSPYQSYKDSSIYNNNDNNNYYRESMNDNKPIQDSDDDVLDRTKIKVNVENHNDPFTNNGGFYGGYDWEKQSQKILERLQSEDFGIHSPNTGDEKESSINQNYDTLLVDADEILRKLNLNKLEDNSAIKEKETSADRNSGNPYDLNSIIQKGLQKDLERLNIQGDSKKAGDNNYLDTLLQEEIKKLNLSKFKDNSADTVEEKEGSADKNSIDPYDINSMMQKEVEKLKIGGDSDNTGSKNLWPLYLQKKTEKVDVIRGPVVLSPISPRSTSDKAEMNNSTGKSLDEVIKIPDLLMSHTGNVDVNKAHDLLKSLKADNNDNH